MFRKTLIAATAVAAIATALVPATASAKGFKGGHWGHYGAGLAIIGAGLAYSASCYQWVQTRTGDFVRVNLC